MSTMTVDLHNHSYYSDGVLSPEAVIDLAKDRGCDVFALTDHDTTAGLVEAQERAQQINLDLVPGVEISAIWSNMTVHIVGLGIDANNTQLQTGLKQHQDFRLERAKKMARGLSAAGILHAMEKTQALVAKDMITRTHFAQMLIKEGVCKDMSSVFKRYLTGKKPGGVKGHWADYDQVIDWIHAAGGKAILAHPFRYRMTQTKIKRMLAHLAEAGLDAVELVTYHSTDEEIALMSSWANDYNLLHSCGSDYHGWPNQRVQIGQLKPMVDSDKHIWNYL